jgi:hypothetical protein
MASAAIAEAEQGGDQSAYDMRGSWPPSKREMFCMTAMAHSPEGQEFRKIAREQGLKAAIRWREQRFK